MRTFKIKVMHPGGTVYEYTIHADNYETDKTHLIIKDEYDNMNYFPLIFTIFKIK